MSLRFLSVRIVAAAVMAMAALTSTASAQIQNYFEDFEGLDRNDPAALSGSGWNVAASGIQFAGPVDFFAFFGAGNDINNPVNSVISDVPSGGGPPIGQQGLVAFSDYNSDIHAVIPGQVRNTFYSDLVISVFQQRTISAADIGNTYDFSWIADGNSNPPSGDALTEAFLLVLDPNNGFSATVDLAVDTTGVADGSLTPGTLSVDLSNPALDGQVLQFGFRNTSSDGEGSAVDYDNVSFAVAVPEPSSMVALAFSSVLLISRRRRS